MLGRYFVALTLVAATLVASGCGFKAASSSNPGAGTQASSPLSSTALIARADAICARVGAKLSSITLRTPQDFARLIPPLAAFEQSAAVEMDRLVPPASMASDWQQMLSGFRTLANDTDKIGQDAREKHLKVSAALFASGTQAMSRLNAIAKREGFSSCSKAF